MSQETQTSQFKSLRAVSPGTIIASKLSELTTVLHEGTVLEAEMAHLLSEIRDLATGLEDYIASCTTPESPALAQLVAIQFTSTYVNKTVG